MISKEIKTMLAIAIQIKYHVTVDTINVALFAIFAENRRKGFVAIFAQKLNRWNIRT